MRKITELAQIAPVTHEEIFIHSLTGEEIALDIKELKPDEINEVLYGETRPQAPLQKQQPFNKDELTGRVTPNYDFEDLDYRRRMAEYNDRFVFRWIIASVTFDIQGETLADKINTLKNNLPNWVFSAFRQKLEWANGITDSDIAKEKKKLKKTMPIAEN